MKLFGSRRIYLDYASATPIRAEAKAAYDDASVLVGNPGSIHTEGQGAKRSLDASRELIAAELGCKARELIFTAGLTEANNLAILGLANRIEGQKGNLQRTHWMVSAIEHQSVLECFVEIERRGGTVTHIDPDEKGIIRAGSVARALRKETIFVSIGWANSEIGTIQPLRDIAGAIRAHEKEQGSHVVLHADAGQAPLYLSPQVHTLGVDLLSLGSGKLYGPRGIGALYIGKRVELAPLTIGGGQERGLRAGTESPALAAGFAAALAAAGRERRIETERVRELRDKLADTLRIQIPDMITNGDLRHALPHMLNLSIPHINSEYVVLALDQAGVAVSTKSACSEGRMNESHVVAALIGDEAPERWRAENTLRISLGLSTTKGDIDRCAHELIRIIKEMPVS